MSPKLAAIILTSAVALFAAVIFDFLVSWLAMADFGRMPIWVVLLSAAFLAEFAVVVVLVVALVFRPRYPLLVFDEEEDLRILQ
jgi:hypothetical protein